MTKWLSIILLALLGALLIGTVVAPAPAPVDCAATDADGWQWFGRITLLSMLAVGIVLAILTLFEPRGHADA